MKTDDTWKDDNCDCEIDTKLLEKHCNELMVHFDSVLILVTKHSGKENSTTFDWKGRGNRFAHSGMVRAWLVKDDEGSRACARPNPNKEDGEE